MSDTLEETPWYEHSEQVILAAEYLAGTGASGWDVFNLFQKPWEHTEVYQNAMAAMVTFMMDVVDEQ